MNNSLDLNDLKKIRDALSAAINETRSAGFKAFENKEISRSEFFQASQKWGDLETKEFMLQGLIMSLELGYILNSNVNSPGSRIQAATKRLENAAQQIKNFGSFLSAIATVINIVGSVVTAIQTGGILKLPA